MGVAANTIDSKIINYLNVLNFNEKKVVLSVVETFAKENKQNIDFWDELSKTQQLAIGASLKEVEDGKLTPHKEVMLKLRSKK